MRVGRTRRFWTTAGCGDILAHITSPEKQSSIEKLGIILGDSVRENLRFPSGGGDFIPLQLPDNLKSAIGAVQLSAARDMLPGLQEAFEIERRHGLDFAPQAANGGAMDARQDTAVAPFQLALLCFGNGRA